MNRPMVSALTIFFLSTMSSLAVFAECINSPSTTPAAQFTDLNVAGQDVEVIEDYKTGLMWARCFWNSSWDISDGNCRIESDATITWKAALKAVDEANTNSYLGYTDWRMANVKELASIVERQCHSPAINEVVFPLPGNAASGAFWTNTPVYGGTAIRVISFFDGRLISQDYMTQYYLRLVRDVLP